MNHPFSPSQLSPTLCSTCKRTAIDHTDRATCEVCGCSGEMNITSNDILMCPDCDYKDHRPRTEDELNSRATEVRRRFDEIDTSIKISTDIFNAKMLGIHELKNAIDQDTTIPADQKYFILAQTIDKRFTKLTEVIFGANETKLHAENEQRAIQTYYNELGKRLRGEEKEKIRLKDATYQPITKPDVQKTPKAPKIKSAPNPNEVRAACVRANVPDAVALVTMFMVAKKLTAEEAISTYKQVKGIP